ncbi:putative leucine-rich repeat receptor-like serine/threonine-protein kinase At2g24130 [Telopea speciosissima]|uniref:putative leucine-rich repeat receptor-like serine/threonine-protein kinase At2g24130 n=1 Tax=Telopea speciosissima TaxID=54955 RepID=UPI001CC6EAC0|nr:putative leucine-rich repeat receptor-like serine/threonine-protein kinase At2g24130 [Telopea speciosissima]
MASISATLLLFNLISIAISPSLSASVVEDLNNLQPPPDFNTTISNNCVRDPALRYCKYISIDLEEIFKSTIVAAHLCNESKNPNCVESFPKIDLRSSPKIAPLYLSFSFFWKYCPLTILSIDLSNNSIHGPVPLEILNCTQIQALDLSHNQLTGDLPIERFSPLTNLSLLNLSYNHFFESKLSDSHFFARFNSSSFLHSGLLPDHSGFRIKAVIFLIGFPIFVILLVGCWSWLCFCRPDILPSVFRQRHKFTPSMLKAATAGFSERNLVGRSRGVEIYKGVLRDKTEVRIEIYKEKISREQCSKFVKECKVFVQLSHRNLVRVMGWCNQGRLRVIITEWIDGENIEMWLSGSPPWKHRLKVLMGVVDGMSYMQEQWPEIGYDLRTSGVMLSQERGPLISRFKVGEQNGNTKKIYRFGLFLLEMITNRRPQEEFEKGETGFIEWVSMHYPDNMQKVIDERMKKTGTMYEQAKEGIGVALMCTDLSMGHQPSLTQISNMLKAFESPLVSSNNKKSHRERGENHRQ